MLLAGGGILGSGMREVAIEVHDRSLHKACRRLHVLPAVFKAQYLVTP